MAKLQEHAVVQILKICDRYQDEKTPLMMILSDIQNEYGYIPLEVQEIVSQQTGISVAEIYGVVTFYSFFSMTPKGKNVIGVCMGTACYVKGAQQVIDRFHIVVNGEVIAQPLEFDVENVVVARFASPFGCEGDGDLRRDKADDQRDKRQRDILGRKGRHRTGDQHRESPDGRPFGDSLVFSQFLGSFFDVWEILVL